MWYKIVLISTRDSLFDCSKRVSIIYSPYSYPISCATIYIVEVLHDLRRNIVIILIALSASSTYECSTHSFLRISFLSI